mmetsp:Transcript_3777/g.8548  ORF Transcript_3777/g.8548 Transcript_3777/m.8548 type:complete len:84 (-) Transcript_3777:343-594(-)
MSSKHQKGPDLKRFMDKRLKLSLNGNRKVVGTLRGYDAFLNIVLENATSESSGESGDNMGTIVIRGNSIIQFESLERTATSAT